MVQAMVKTFAAASSLKTGIHIIEQLQPNLDKVGFDPVKQKGEHSLCLSASVTCGRTIVLISSRSRLCVILLHGAPGVGKTSTAGKLYRCKSRTSEKRTNRLINQSM